MCSRRNSVTECGDGFSEAVVRRSAMPAGIRGRPYVCWSRDRTGAADPQSSHPVFRHTLPPAAAALLAKATSSMLKEALRDTRVRVAIPGSLATMRDGEIASVQAFGIRGTHDRADIGLSHSHRSGLTYEAAGLPRWVGGNAQTPCACHFHCGIASDSLSCRSSTAKTFQVNEE